MPETRRFDPRGWFLSACCTVLAGAVALTVAVHLIAAIWIWLVTIAGIAVLVGAVVSLLVWWHRRQPW
jgi:hypothetical protein